MTVIPGNIEREHIIIALNEIDIKGYESEHNSTKYDIIHNGKRYPPKYVLSLANKFANGKELSDFNSIQAKKFLENLHFEIDEKDTSFELTEPELSDYIDKAISKPRLHEIFSTIKRQNNSNKQDINVKDCIVFPDFNGNMSIEDLAKTYRDIEKGKSDKHPINIPSSFNVIPSKSGDCRENLVAFIIDKIDFERRMSDILASFIKCKHKKVILAVCYWDGNVWEITWKKPFEAVGGEVYRQMYDGKPERII